MNVFIAWLAPFGCFESLVADFLLFVFAGFFSIFVQCTNLVQSFSHIQSEKQLGISAAHGKSVCNRQGPDLPPTNIASLK